MSTVATNPDAAAGLAAWEEAVRDPALHDLPYKVETNGYGQLVLSPHTLMHSRYQGALARLLRRHISEAGEVNPEIPLQTTDGVKVADVAWISRERLNLIPADATAAPMAPEICVEVRSGSNTDAEMAHKRALYIEAGAEEVWICDIGGTLTFHNADGAVPESPRVPSFPT
jgi:Uma2 family endonuclease